MRVARDAPGGFADEPAGETAPRLDTGPNKPILRAMHPKRARTRPSDRFRRTTHDRAAAATLAGLVVATAAHAVPPRYFAQPVPGIEHPCFPGVPGSIAPVRGFDLAEDGRVACEADCGSTVGGSVSFVVFPDGTVEPYSRGTFDFAEPAGFLSDGRLLFVGDWCPPVSGPCTTALAVGRPLGLDPIVIASSSVGVPVVHATRDNGWAVGWGPISATDGWRLRADGTLEELSVPKGRSVTPEGVGPTGIVAGHAYQGSLPVAVKWSASSTVGTVLAPLAAGAASRALGVGDDGSVVGESGGRAAWWYLPSGPSALLPAGSASVATHMAGNPAAANPIGFAIFGTHANGTRLFRANGPASWTDLMPIDGSAQIAQVEVTAAPRPDLMVARGLTPLYQPVGFVWTLGDQLRRLDAVVVNPPAAEPGQPAQPFVAIDANAMRTILAERGFGGRPYLLRPLAAGDTDGDGAVNGGDLARLLSSWGAVPAGTRGAADFDGDGVVNGADVATLLSNWG